VLCASLFFWKGLAAFPEGDVIMKKIITFISPFSPAFRLENEPDRYLCPDGFEVTGKQTNEAPVKYLLHCDPEIQQIISILTTKVRQPIAFTAPVSAPSEEKTSTSQSGTQNEPVSTINLIPYNYFKDEILKIRPNMEFLDVNFTTGDFYAEALPVILSYIGPKDEIYLDITGGFRDTVLQLTLLSRILNYQGTKISGAVYSRFPQREKGVVTRPGEIADVTSTYLTFDLINGLNEFDKFCATDSMKQYYTGGSPVPELDALMSAMQSLSDCITLCRTKKMNQRIETFRTALKAAKQVNDPILNVLLPIFEEKFRCLSTTPEQILWCVENNLIQQALTIYTDRLPRYLIKEVELIILPNNYFKQVEANYKIRYNNRYISTLADKDIEQNKVYNNKDPYNYALNDGFFKLSYNLIKVPTGKDVARYTMKCLRSLVPSYGFRFKVANSIMEPILNDYLYIQVLRNQFNHVNEELRPQEDRANYLKGLGYETDMDKLPLDKLKERICTAVRRIQSAVSETKQ
jgi:hypothetical protein